MSTYSAGWRRLVAEAIANGARCVDCGTDRNLEGDHELPLSRGGLSTRANLSIRCKRHNRAKGNRVTRYQLRIAFPYEPTARARETAFRTRPGYLRADGPTPAVGIPSHPSLEGDRP
jgi:5-methylcytosine-specific restriction endonuclease McrA